MKCGNKKPVGICLQEEDGGMKYLCVNCAPLWLDSDEEWGPPRPYLDLNKKYFKGNYENNIRGMKLPDWKYRKNFRFRRELYGTEVEIRPYSRAKVTGRSRKTSGKPPKKSGAELLAELEEISRRIIEGSESVTDIAKEKGLTAGYLKAQLGILGLPEDIKDLIRDGTIKVATAIILSRLPEEDLRRFQAMVNAGVASWTVKNVEAFKASLGPEE